MQGRAPKSRAKQFTCKNQLEYETQKPSLRLLTVKQGKKKKKRSRVGGKMMNFWGGRDRYRNREKETEQEKERTADLTKW